MFFSFGVYDWLLCIKATSAIESEWMKLLSMQSIGMGCHWWTIINRTLIERTLHSIHWQTILLYITKYIYKTLVQKRWLILWKKKIVSDSSSNLTPQEHICIDLLKVSRCMQTCTLFCFFIHSHCYTYMFHNIPIGNISLKRNTKRKHHLHLIVLHDD